MGKQTKATAKLTAKEIAKGLGYSASVEMKLMVQSGRLKQLKKEKKDRKIQKKISDLEKQIKQKTGLFRKVQKAFGKQRVWNQEAMKELGELEDKMDAETDKAKKKELQKQLKKKFNEWSRKATPMFESIEALKKMLPDAKKIENEVNNIETSDLVC